MTAGDLQEVMRLFVAISIPDEVRSEMIGAQQELREPERGKLVHWTKPDQFHLTLKFLGDVPANCVEALKNAVESACADSQVLHLRAAGIGFFPNHRAPRVIWAGIEGERDRLMQLQSKIAGAVRPFTSEPVRENFVSHLTLGRFKAAGGRQIGELVNRALAMQDREFGSWQAGEVEIVRSQLRPTGAVHTVLAAIALGTN